jgi:septum formation protein
MEKHMKFILASGSPRRKALLEAVGVQIHKVSPANIIEKRQPHEDPLAYCQRLAKEKSMAQYFENGLILAADTIVTKEHRVFEKPINEKNALEILQFLQDTWHDVITAWSIYNCKTKQQQSGHAVSKVLFRPLSAQQCISYIHTGEGKDKAGGYGIQGLGAALVSTIEGSFSNIVGLPMEQIIPILYQQQLIGPRA